MAAILTTMSCAGTRVTPPWETTPGTIGSVKFLNQSTRSDVAVGWPRISDRLPSTGNVRVAVLFVDFHDSVATANPETLFNIQKESAEIFNAVSYGRMTYDFVPLFKWIRMPNNYGSYGFSRGNLTFEKHKHYIQSVIALAETEFDFSDIDSVVVLANPKTPFDYGPAFCANSSGAVMGTSHKIFNGVTSGTDGWASEGWWLTHESGHTLGLVDLYAFETGPTLDTFRFTGDFGVMGKSFTDHLAPEPLAWERWQLGWLDDDQIVPLHIYPTTVSLTPIESSGGIKAAIIPLSATKGIVIESRHALGYDQALTREGVLVYTIDTAIDSGYGPIVVQGGASGDLTKVSALLRKNESITVLGYQILVTDQSASGETVRISKP